MEIIKKAYSKYFEKVLSGEKKFDIRLADENYNVGDVLVLKEIDDDRNFTGREIRKKITYVIKTKDCDYWPLEDVNKFGFAVLQIE